jgi:uncharacterized protein YjbJ (UPF0337 family)
MGIVIPADGGRSRSRADLTTGGPSVYPPDALPLRTFPERREVFDMNADIFKGKWKQLQGRAKQVWGDLTDDDLAKIDGSYDRFVGVLQEKYGYTKEEAQQKIDSEFGAA